jgi:hypothetical protein
MLVQAQGFSSAIWKQKSQFGVIECGIRAMNDRVMIGAEQDEVVEHIRAPTRAVDDVVSFS